MMFVGRSFAALITGNCDMQPKKIIIIGGGIAGLCAAVYARKCGYEVDVLEMGHTPGGLATSWRRGDYIFETCLHWLLGSNPKGPFHSRWLEVFDIEKLTFVDQEEYMRLETIAANACPSTRTLIAWKPSF